MWRSVRRPNDVRYPGIPKRQVGEVGLTHRSPGAVDAGLPACGDSEANAAHGSPRNKLPLCLSQHLVAGDSGECVTLPQPRILFGQLETTAKTVGGARQIFQMLVTDLIEVQHPAATNEVEAPSGSDWGIDTYVGRFDETLMVWQSKFFLDWNATNHRKQVRGSFNQLMKKANEENFKVEAWTLCIPCVLPPEEQQWFDRWASKQRRENGVKIELLNGVRLRTQLQRADAHHVLHHYFASEAPPSRGTAEPIESLEDLSCFDDALFVHQLEVAGQQETDAARGLFFAADALFRDLSSRRDKGAMSALEELHLEVQAVWEGHFNAGASAADCHGRIVGLLEAVMDAAAKRDDPEGLRLRPAHRKGVAHRLVEASKAGWVTHWREVAATHTAGRTPGGSTQAYEFRKHPVSRG